MVRAWAVLFHTDCVSFFLDFLAEHVVSVVLDDNQILRHVLRYPGPSLQFSLFKFIGKLLKNFSKLAI